MLQNHMQNVAKAVEKTLPPFTGFIVLAFPFSEKEEARVHYVSNAKREDALAAMAEFLLRNGWADPKSN